MKKHFIRERRIYCGEKYCEVDIIPRTAMQEKVAKGKRAKRTKESAPKQNNINDKNARRYLVQTVNGNFGTGDYHISATYKPKYMPETIEDAEKVVGNYLRRIAYAMKRKGTVLKYVIVTEYIMSENEKPKNIHHHIVINSGLDRDEVEALWSMRRKKGEKKGDGIGIINCDRLQAEGNGLEAIAKYITKRHGSKGKKRWSSSRNLIRPESIKNDHKYRSKRKIEMIAKENDNSFWEKEYSDYKISEVEKVYYEDTGWHIYLKMWKKE
ncbi:MAG: hypothetical protein RSA29_02760 [Clostridium sp.]|uniref:rolling circle replication-associated protein n=1 Tax=Clostridium sp. TaxID=1506 RepID=UPI003063B4B1